MDSRNTLQQASLIKQTLACVRCSERKVKCDKKVPCNACVRHNVECIFRPENLSKRKRSLEKFELLQERLEICEKLLQENGIDASHITNASARKRHRRGSSAIEFGNLRRTPTPISTSSGSRTTVFRPQLLQGQQGTKLVDNNLWSRVLEEQAYDTGFSSERGSTSDSGDSENPQEDLNYLLNHKDPGSTESHPSEEQIHYLWQAFLENVNPLTHLIHVPTLQPMFERAVAELRNIPRGFEALMFAIYSMAVLSLAEEECLETLGEKRKTLLSRYVTATKVALSRASFMSSTSIIVLQALILHILSIRDYDEPGAVWSLTGLAIRRAESMGMHLDGTLLGLTAFETEMYRRIWWQLKMHDFRAAELCGQAKFRNFSFDDTSPKKPANVNDCEIYPAMTDAAICSEKPTEMIWCALRSDLASFAAMQKAKLQNSGKQTFVSEEYSAIDDMKMKDDFIKKLEDMMETKYLRYCDPSQPLQLMTLLGARISSNLIRFIAHHPRRWASMDQVSTSEQQFVWDIVVQLLNQYKMMQSNPQLKRFAWNIPYFIQWHAVIHVLDTLRSNPHHKDAETVWPLIEALYENNSDLLLSMRKPISVAVGNLCLKAFEAHLYSLGGKRGSCCPPYYISRLREQREAVRRKREQENFRHDFKDNSAGKAGSEVLNANESITEDQKPGEDLPTEHVIWPNDAPNSLVENTDATFIDLFSTENVLSDNEIFNSSLDEAIDWEQWDTWMGVLNPKLPSFDFKFG